MTDALQSLATIAFLIALGSLWVLAMGLVGLFVERRWK